MRIRLRDRLRAWLRLSRVEVHGAEAGPRRGRVDHVIILDGTLSSLRPGWETNAGLLYKLMRERAPSAHLSVYYEAGIQMRTWRQTKDVLEGRGINRQIRRAYGHLASRYHPGDRIFLFGYSRGAYAARSLAGVIDRIGLLRAEEATARNVRQAYRHYQLSPDSPVAADFSRLYCHDRVEIEMIGAWDTVKALGLGLPGFRQRVDARHAFHNHHLGPVIRHGFHALAMDETRTAYTPVLWSSPEDWPGKVEQVWFRGTHGDVGGMLGGFHAARPLANIPLVWMLEKAEEVGLELPSGWRARFPTDPAAPMVGSWGGVGMLFLSRRRRLIAQDASEAIHPSALEWYRRRYVGPDWSPGPAEAALGVGRSRWTAARSAALAEEIGTGEGGAGAEDATGEGAVALSAEVAEALPVSQARPLSPP